METRSVDLLLSDRLLERVDEACEREEFADRSEVVSAAIERAGDGRE